MLLIRGNSVAAGVSLCSKADNCDCVVWNASLRRAITRCGRLSCPFSRDVGVHVQEWEGIGAKERLTKKDDVCYKKAAMERGWNSEMWERGDVGDRERERGKGREGDGGEIDRQRPKTEQ